MILTNQTCSSCQDTFTNDYVDSWSTDFPSILNLDRTKSCTKCLTLSMKKEIAQYLQNLTPDKTKNIQSLGKPTKFIEGIDYNLNTQGAWVFTAWYLLRQGYCCGNGCMNCPYDSITTLDETNT